MDPVERYLAKVDRRGPDECWPWTAARFDKGYGAFRLGNGQLKAHRFGYEAFVGPIGDGLYVCHTCDNPPCQNPKHWFLGTHRDNAHDREAKGRGNHGEGPLRRPLPRPGRARGERHGRSPLTASQVREIRALYASGLSQDAIAARFPISQRAVSKIVLRQSWDHVD